MNNNLIENLVKSILKLVSTSKLTDENISKDMNEEFDEILFSYFMVIIMNEDKREKHKQLGSVIFLRKGIKKD